MNIEKKSKNVVVCVSGGIACYKIPDVVSKLKKNHVNVDVIMTKNACRFVNPITFQTISKNVVVTDPFELPKAWAVEHVELAKKADLILVAPATANIIGKVANGIADDMVTTTIMAAKCKVIFAPSMNVNMYENPIFKQNVEKLSGFGYEFLEPGDGFLACGDLGKGRLPEPQEIVDYVMGELGKSQGEPDVKKQGPKPLDLLGKKILVTAGPTVEAIDPVRYIGNRSSGKMGYAIAKAAKARGAEVVLVSGPTALEIPQGVRCVFVESTLEMQSAVEEHFPWCDVVIKAAAPADYRVEEVFDHKIKKTDGDGTLTIKLVKNPDILMGLGEKKGNKILVGFAAETQNLEAYAKDKIQRKHLDFIVANNVAVEGAGFSTDTNIITIIDSNFIKTPYEKMSKAQVSDVILNKVKDYIRE